MVVHVNILTGAATEDLGAFHEEDNRLFKHNLWVPADSYKLFRHHPVLRRVYIKLCEAPVELKKPWVGTSPLYYNIAQFVSPWSLFRFFLYFRQTLKQVPYGVSFQHETELLCHSIKMGFTENYWVTRSFLKQNLSEFRIRRGSRAVVVDNILCGIGRKKAGIFYNIQQANDPQGVKARIEYTALSAVNGKPLYSEAQRVLFEVSCKYRLVSPYWFQSDRLQLLHSCGIDIPGTLECRCSSGPQGSQFTYFNIEQTSDPLGVYKTFSQTAVYFGKLRDFCTSKPLSYSDCFAIVNKKQLHQHFSPFFINSDELRKCGAKVKFDEVRNPFYVPSGAGKWKTLFNLEQIENKLEVLKKRVHGRL